MSSKRRSKRATAGPFVQLTAELLRSPAWSTLSINGRRLVDFLLIEHMAHAGTENGNLAAPYTQLEERGIGRRLIASAIREVEEHGLVVVQRGGKKGRQITETSRYRLTFLPTREAMGDGKWTTQIEPTDDWRRYGKA